MIKNIVHAMYIYLTQSAGEKSKAPEKGFHPKGKIVSQKNAFFGPFRLIFAFVRSREMRKDKDKGCQKSARIKKMLKNARFPQNLYLFHIP